MKSPQARRARADRGGYAAPPRRAAWPIQGRRLARALGVLASLGLVSSASAGDLGYPASALAAFSGAARPSFTEAPAIAKEALAEPGAPLAPAERPVSAETAAPSAAVAAASSDAAEPEPDAEPSLSEYEAACFVKIDGRVLTSRPCRILREKGKEVIFQLAEGPLTIRLHHGRTWTARLEGRDFGNVFKTGECWGAHGFYACDKGRR